MGKPSLILVGAGGHAHACIDVIEQHGHYQIAGIVGMPEQLHSRHLGYAVIAADDNLSQLSGPHPFAVITVGQIQSPGSRIRLYEMVARIGFQLPSIVAPTAYVSRHATIGAGTVVMHGAIINAAAKVGSNCIINTRALVEHDATVEDHCHISTGAILNGDARVGAGSFVGSGSVIKEGVSIGQNCVVGMGLTVRRDLADHSRFVERD
jgi:sugar O-acyltransferase (sialic acid O-acetyltransferase NeuD family)